MKKLMIAGTKSGVGKTTVTMGLLAALSKNLKVQPFKVGPDYIDSAYHSYITDNICSNLDSYILGKPMINYLFNKNCMDKDIAVVEGVMGLFDGAEVGSDVGTSASIAKILDIPVILVVDGSKVASSLAATVKGFELFDENLNIAGLIINNVGSKVHYDLLKDAIEYYTDVKPCGYLLKNSDITMPERHLGLVPVGELEDFKEIFANLASHIEETIDLELVIELANEFEPHSISSETGVTKEFKQINQLVGKDIINDQTFEMIKDNSKREEVVIAIAKDQGFNFYYQDSLDLLTDYHNVKWVEYSPIKDSKLPGGIHGLYIGGGFPEVFARDIEANESMRQDLIKHLASGLPYIAECGGLMYLGESLIDLDEQTFNMVGWLKGTTTMTKRLQRFGYAQLSLTEDCLLGNQGDSIKIHEFHRSKADVDEHQVYSLDKIRKNQVSRSWTCGFSKNQGIAAYAHFHFGSNLMFGKNFVDKCINYRERL